MREAKRGQDRINLILGRLWFFGIFSYINFGGPSRRLNAFSHVRELLVYIFDYGHVFVEFSNEILFALPESNHLSIIGLRGRKS